MEDEELLKILKACVWAFNIIPNTKIVSFKSVRDFTYRDTYELASKLDQVIQDIEAKPSLRVSMADLKELEEILNKIQEEYTKNKKVNLGYCFEQAVAPSPGIDIPPPDRPELRSEFPKPRPFNR